MMDDIRYTISGIRKQVPSRTSYIVRRISAAWRSQGGYTIVELIAAMSIFALISVAVIAALISIMQSSTKTGAERRTQQDARYGIEEIARQSRSASIDYAFYVQNAGDARCAFGTVGSQPNSTKALALVFTESDEANAPVSKRLIFFQEGEAIYRFENNVGSPTPSCDSVFAAPTGASSGPTKSKITSNKVTVPTLTFYLSPNQDPYAQTACDTNCQIARNTHPRVTILMTTQIVGSGTGVNQQTGSGVTTLQTTVGSRSYPSEQLLGQPAT